MHGSSGDFVIFSGVVVSKKEDCEASEGTANAILYMRSMVKGRRNTILPFLRPFFAAAHASARAALSLTPAHGADRSALALAFSFTPAHAASGATLSFSLPLRRLSWSA